MGPVIARAAEAWGKTAMGFSFDPDSEDFLCYGCTWTLVMDEATRNELGPAMVGGERLKAPTGFRTWTDDYSSMFGILK
jgi:hypothetical protein